MKRFGSRRAARPTAVMVVVATLAALLIWQRPFGEDHTADRYLFGHAQQMDLRREVTVNGTVRPTSVVNVGTQVSGTIQRVYADDGDRVAKGALLAALDPSLYRAELDRARARLSTSQAQLRFARFELARFEKLAAEGYVSSLELEQRRQAADTAHAAVRNDEAGVASAASNFSYTAIRAPVSGVILRREVEAGQTVAAQFQTPTLFRIAESLDTLRIECSVPEADIGEVQTGQAVRFGVDALPDREFHGRVSQVRPEPTTQQGVVSYTVIVAVEGGAEALRNGMTALAHIVVAEHPDVMAVPTAALQFHPVGTPTTTTAGVHVLPPDGPPLRVPVQPGARTDDWTEIASDPRLPSGTPVIIGEIAPEGGARSILPPPGGGTL